jgi:hypothetical protein
MANAFLARSSHRDKIFEGAVMTSTHPELLQQSNVATLQQVRNEANFFGLDNDAPRFELNARDCLPAWLKDMVQNVFDSSSATVAISGK